MVTTDTQPLTIADLKGLATKDDLKELSRGVNIVLSEWGKSTAERLDKMDGRLGRLEREMRGMNGRIGGVEEKLNLVLALLVRQQGDSDDALGT